MSKFTSESILIAEIVNKVQAEHINSLNDLVALYTDREDVLSVIYKNVMFFSTLLNSQRINPASTISKNTAHWLANKLGELPVELELYVVENKPF